MMVKPALFDNLGRLDHLRRRRAGLEHGCNRIEGRIGCRMQVAIELAWLAQRKTAQHLPRMVPERSSDLGHHRVACLHPPHARKLTRHAEIRRAHRRDTDVVNDIDCAMRDVSTLDQITELALVQTGFKPIAQRRHAKIAEMRADAQPVELLGGFHLP